MNETQLIEQLHAAMDDATAGLWAPQDAAQRARARGRRHRTARGLLATTSAPLRGFEFDYVRARLARGAGRNGPAPDLVEFVARPEVETRYAVLHPLERRVAFICRDGSIRVRDLTRPAEPGLLHARADAARGPVRDDGHRGDQGPGRDARSQQPHRAHPLPLYAHEPAGIER